MVDVTTATKPSAAVQRLRLRTELRRARLAANMTQKQIAQAMEWSPSKLIRIEAGEVGISVNDLRPLLAAYGISDRRKVEKLLDLARGSRKMPFTEYRDIYTKEVLDFLAMEAAASINRTVQPQAVPGLLQTEEYASATIQAFSPTGSERLDRMVEARMLRQEVLENEEAEFFFIVDESVIRRQVGGPGVLRNQLLRMAELAERPWVNIMILPFSLGMHAALAGPFTIFEFTEDMPDFVYLENPRGSATVSTAADVATSFLEGFWELEDKVIKKNVPEILRQVAEALDEPPADLTVAAAQEQQEE